MENIKKREELKGQIKTLEKKLGFKMKGGPTKETTSKDKKAKPKDGGHKEKKNQSLNSTEK
jgi:hypothetical protein